MSVLQRENQLRNKKRTAKKTRRRWIYLSSLFWYSCSLSLSLYLWCGEYINLVRFFYPFCDISLFFSFLPSLSLERRRKRGFVDVFDFSLDDDDFGRRWRRFVFLSLSLSTRWYRLFVLIKSSLNNLSVMNNIIKNRHRIHRLRRRLGISAAPERRFEEDTFFSQQQQQEQECSAQLL